MLPFLNATVTRIEKITELTWRFFFRLDELDRFDFLPGQFVTLDLPIHDKPAKRWRSYSIASWPDGTNGFELVIVLLEGGAGTNYLFNEVKEGSVIPVRGPQGVFTLHEPLDKDLFLVCTGTGIAPFRSMVHHILENKISHHNIYLIFGCRKLCDALYGEELRSIADQLEDFHYIPTFSREDPGTHRSGYVHEVYANLIEEKRQEGQLKPALFYLCGWKNMIDEAKHRIQEIGYDRRSIHQELYG